MRKTIVALVIAGVLAWVIVWRWHHLLAWSQNSFGFRRGDGESPHYLFWSGIGSNLAYLSIIGGVVIYYRQKNCKRKWCPLIGDYPFTNPETGISRNLCWVHHPRVHDRTLTGARIREIQGKHHLYLGGKPGDG